MLRDIAVVVGMTIAVGCAEPSDGASSPEPETGDLLALAEPTHCSGTDTTGVTGVVRDATTGAALPGVIVLVTGTCGVLTDSLGRYALLDIDDEHTTVRYEIIGHCVVTESFIRDSLNRRDVELAPKRVALSHDPDPEPEC